MRRREFITLVGGATVTGLAAWPVATEAQQSKPILIAILLAASAASASSQLDAFRDAMRQLGYIEGRNVRFEYRFADGEWAYAEAKKGIHAGEASFEVDKKSTQAPAIPRSEDAEPKESGER